MLRFTMVGLLILLAFASAALAVDGTVLINQSTMTNGLTGCPTGGTFPIIICQPGSYRLSGNITVPDANTDAIHITADNLSLDLNGFAILGPVTCKTGTFPVRCSTKGSGIGISSNNANTALSNGTVNGMGNAGVAALGTGARIDGLRVSNNAGVFGAGIGVFQAVISNCTVTTNAGDGIVTTVGVADGLTVFGNVTVTQSIISFNGGDGIHLIGGQTGSILASNNGVFTNGQDGLFNVRLAVNNNIVGNVGFGFSCSDASCSFEGNVFKSNGGTVSNGTSLGHNSSNGSVF